MPRCTECGASKMPCNHDLHASTMHLVLARVEYSVSETFVLENKKTVTVGFTLNSNDVNMSLAVTDDRARKLTAEFRRNVRLRFFCAPPRTWN